MERRLRLRLSLAWGLPPLAAFSSGFVYFAFHLILKVSQEKLVLPELAFSGSTVVFVMLLYFAIKYRISHAGNSIFMVAAICGYVLTLNLLVAHYLVKLNIEPPRDALGIMICSLVLFSFGALIGIRKRLKGRSASTTPD